MGFVFLRGLESRDPAPARNLDLINDVGLDLSGTPTIFQLLAISGGRAILTGYDGADAGSYFIDSYSTGFEVTRLLSFPNDGEHDIETDYSFLRMASFWLFRRYGMVFSSR